MPNKGQFSTTFYFRSLEDELSYAESALKFGTPLSTYIHEMADLGRAEKDAEPKAEANSKGYVDLKAKVAELEEALENERSRRRALEYTLKYKDFGDQYDYRDYDVQLVTLLKHGKTYDSDDILKALGIQGDLQALKLVRTQLETLVRYGLVKETVAGWKWIR